MECAERSWFAILHLQFSILVLHTFSTVDLPGCSANQRWRKYEERGWRIEDGEWQTNFALRIPSSLINDAIRRKKISDPHHSRVGLFRALQPLLPRHYCLNGCGQFYFARGKCPHTASSTQMSSSSSSQRKARPLSRSLTFSSRFCGALASNGYLVAGKLTNRPSASSRHTRRASTQQRAATVSVVGSMTMPLNISFQQFLAMLFHQLFNAAKLGGGKTTIVRA